MEKNKMKSERTSSKIGQSKEKMKSKETGENVMRKIRLEKVILSVGGTGDVLEKGTKILERVSLKKVVKRKSKKRIPSLGVRPGLEVGAMITIRKNPEEILKRLLATNENVLKIKQVSENTFSFGIKEYIEIPGMDYQRDIGIIGFDVTVTLKRAGKRIRLKKIKRGKIPLRQTISKEEVIKFMEDNFQTKFI
ncbi:MAG: 50S ribosomal protein L5 [archaeon]